MVKAATATANEDKTTEELTKDALSEVEDPEVSEAEADPDPEEITPAIKDNSMVTVSTGKGGRRRMTMTDYNAMLSKQAADAAESSGSDGGSDD